MTQLERRLFLIRRLIEQSNKNCVTFKEIKIPKNTGLQRQLLRTLLKDVAPDQLSSQVNIVLNEYLCALIAENGITDASTLTEIKKDIYLWKGDITTLKCDAIVCPTDATLKGLLYPQKNEIDNSIHAFAGMELLNDLNQLLNKFGGKVPIGNCVMTNAYNLPSKWILHTVCPTVKTQLTEVDAISFANCHKNCLAQATQHHLKYLALGLLDCIENRSSKLKLAKVAVDTILNYKQKTNSPVKVVICASIESDYEIFYQLLTTT